MTVREMMARMRDLTDNGYGDLEVKYGTPVEFAWLIVDSCKPIEIQLSTRSAVTETEEETNGTK